jgi:hypothetical protein
LELFKILAVKPFEIPQVATKPPEVDEAAGAFDEFVLTQLEEAEGATLTVAEALAGYTDYCSTEGHPRLTPRQFQERLPDAVKKEFGIPANHDTIRDGRAKRGFRNVRLKLREVAHKIETLRTDRTDRTALLEGMERCHSDLTTYLATTM